ncbi:PREDICTED: protein eva-1 homolog C [Dinoponera quadriceps]|uniref:Protein eva-1 homolog C n=1 Tax=Dinoponera quadriceps TaxID=609295 RepID=A0A6P3YCD2_DINQU|nr:PREDICTED: protein eva-1 homolog C [Dinoponera quadriceps]
MILTGAALDKRIVMIVLAVSLLLLRAHRAAGSDNLALLSGTLKTYQRAACDEETMTLKCPPGTTISIEHAQYGRAGMYGISKCNSPVPPMIAGDISTNHTCIWPQSLQHSLLQTVVEVCQKKRQCKFNTSPNTFQGDPCPGLRKYIEVAYKCRPYEFRSKVACENEVINLVCFPGQRVAIFSASFGRTEYESLQCPQPRGVKEETCMVTFATETVMQLCHGKRRCSVVANSTTFGDPCKPDSKTYLKVVYTCVPRMVLREQYEDEVEPDEIEQVHEFDEGFDRTDFRAEFSPSPNLEGPQPQPRDNVSRNFPTVSSSPPRAHTDNDENQEKFYLYIILSVSGGILVFLALVIGRLLVSRWRAKRDAKMHANNEALPNGFTDDISEIDADIDLTTAVPVPMQGARLPETQLAERLHGERYYVDTRIPLSPTTIHATPVHHPTSTGVRDLGNQLVATDNLHTILRKENPRSLNSKSYYYG